jgi:hypothetical protein
MLLDFFGETVTRNLAGAPGASDANLPLEFPQSARDTSSQD